MSFRIHFGRDDASLEGLVAAALIDFNPESLALSNNDPVSAWANDGSIGSGADLSQGTGTEQPTYKATAGIGGLPCVTFDGGDTLSSGDFTTEAQPFTTLSVHYKTANSGGNSVLSTTGGGNDIWQRHTNVLNSEPGLYAGVSLSEGTDTSGNNSKWMYIIGYWNGASSAISLNGAADVTGNAGTAGFDSFRLGASFAGADKLTGGIQRIVVMDGDARANLKAYVLGKYGSTWPLAI